MPGVVIQAVLVGDTDFVLDMRLGLFQGDRELYRFSQEDLAEEIGKTRIMARG